MLRDIPARRHRAALPKPGSRRGGTYISRAKPVGSRPVLLGQEKYELGAPRSHDSLCRRDERMTESSAAERGRTSYATGHSFEERVADAYRLLGYQIELRRGFGGREVDLFLTGHFGDLTVYRAVECKSGPVIVDHLDSFIAKLALVRLEYPTASGTLISGVSFTTAVAEHAAAVGIKLTLFRDLSAQLIDGERYASALLARLKADVQYRLEHYIDHAVSIDDVSADPRNVFEVLDEWMSAAEWNQLTLLGDVGTGKSFVSRVIAERFAAAFLKNPLTEPLPILIDLRNADREFSLEGLILTHLSRSGLDRVSFASFEYALSNGQLVVIFDGFDEMAARVSRNVTHRNFHELARCVRGRAKVLLTCRTHYFKSRAEEEEVILGAAADRATESTRALYWDLIARRGFRIAYLHSFTERQVEEYVSRTRPETAKTDLVKIRNTYNLLELSQRPMLLDMIVKSLDRLTSSDIDAAMLYRVFTDTWVHRDMWRNVLPPDLKLKFLVSLAYSLWVEDAARMHHTRLTQYVHQELAQLLERPEDLVEIDHEIRTASFLTRDEIGAYGFAHKSYGEYFLAVYIAERLSSGSLECLSGNRLTPETVGFLVSLLDAQCDDKLVQLLTVEYVRHLTENALAVLYARRARETPDGRVRLPRRLKLRGARLDQFVLANAELIEADMVGATVTEVNFVRADLRKARLRDGIFDDSDFASADLRGVKAVRASFSGCNFAVANLADGDFTDANFSRAFLLDAARDGALMTGASYAGAVLGNNEEVNDAFMAAIDPLRKLLNAEARQFLLRTDVDPEDLVAETIVRLYSPGRREAFLSTANKAAFALAEFRSVAWHLTARRTFGPGMLPVEIAFSEDDERADEIFELASADEGGYQNVLLREIEARLDPKAWRVLRAHYVEGFTLAEIGRKERLSQKRVQKLRDRSLEILRELMIEQRGVLR